MAEGIYKLHIAMFPWLAFGHIIPYLELAKLIAQKGHKISFISTPRNIDRLPKIPPHLSPLIEFVKLPLPPTDNIPPNAEATMDLPLDQVPYLKRAYDQLQQPLASFLQTSKPDWICYDFAPFWLPPIAAKLGISRAGLFIFWASTICIVVPPPLVNDPRTDPEHFTVSPPWIPFPSNVVTFRLHEIKKLLNMNANHISIPDLSRFALTIEGSEIIASRSCLELEPEWLHLLGELHQKEVVPIGLLPPSVTVSGDSGDEKDWSAINKWLDKQKKGSVVYIAFGSEARVGQEELNELALGLELSGLPFFWARRSDGENEVELLGGFQERTKERGVVWKDWAPQLKILAHGSIGGFLTHCGWSSIIESLHLGIPLIMFPIMGDQGLMARLFEDKKVGLEIPRNEDDGSFTRNEVAETLRVVMAADDMNDYKKNAKEIMKLFGNKELHQHYVDGFVQHLQSRRPALKNG